MNDRPSPNAMLRLSRADGAGRGQLRIYLGMAPGVGKTVAMLEEGNRRLHAGEDVTIGFLETHGRSGTEAAVGDLSVVPRKRITYKGVTLEEMDTDAILARRPSIVLVDELAHSNAPGSAREKRYEDVEVLLDAGITVISTVNIQHLESIAGVVETITGAPVHERLPDRLLNAADEIELVDLSPESLRTRLAAGQIYPPDRAAQALDRFFRPANLATLRELALRKVTSTVERNLETYLRDNDVESVWPAGERVLVAVDAQPASRQLLRRGFRMAHGLHAELLAVFIERSSLSAEDRAAVEANLRYAEDLGARIHRQSGNDIAASIARIAGEENVGSIVVGRSRHGRLHELFRGSIVHELIRAARDVDIYVVSDPERW